MERLVLDLLEKEYKEALKDINLKIQMYLSTPETQSRIYHRQYQETLKKQVEAALEKLHSDEYDTINQYVHDCYTDAFVGTFYDLHGQGVPVIAPIDQNAAIRAVMTDSKLNKPLYDALGVDVNQLKRAVSSEISRGIASGLMYEEIARNIQFRTNAPISRAKTIVRTEGHRIQQASAEDARRVAKSKGANVVKMWDATLDGKTRPTHRELDGQIRETDEYFELGSKKAMYPGEFGDPAEDCNCRCVALTRSRSALDADELKTLQERAKFFGLDKTEDFEDFKKKFLEAPESVEKQGISGYNKGAISGAYNDSNDPDWEKRNAHAELYYTSLRNSKKTNVVEAIAKNAGVERVLVSRMYDHLLVNEYDLDGDKKRFDASYDIAQSLQRLREGKDIQEHDLILIQHEATEYVLMNSEGMSYEDAHDKANEKYNYAMALKKFLKQKDGE
jgi:SPP1 gp7 family putative phage head morphogenesis protein